jgi:hypothetical protein
MQLSKAGGKCFDCSANQGLILVGAYWLCPEHKDKRNKTNARHNHKNNAKNNGSEAHLKSTSPGRKVVQILNSQSLKL